MKKIISIVLSISMLLSFATVANAIEIKDDSYTWDSIGTEIEVVTDSTTLNSILGITNADEFVPTTNDGVVSLKAINTGNNTNTAGVTVGDTNLAFSSGAKNGVNHVVKILAETGKRIEKFQFDAGIMSPGAQAGLLVATSYENSNLYNAVSIASSATLRYYTRTLSGNKITTTQGTDLKTYKNPELTTTNSTPSLETNTVTEKPVTVAAEYVYNNGDDYYLFAMSGKGGTSYFKFDCDGMLENLYFGIARAKTATVKNIGIDYYDFSEDVSNFTEEDIVYWETFGEANPGALTAEDHDAFAARREALADAEKDAEFNEQVNNPYAFSDDFSTADNWDFITPFAYKEAGQANETISDGVKNGQLVLKRQGNVQYHRIYAIKDSAYDNSAIAKASFTIVQNTTTENTKGLFIATSFEDINNYSGINISGKLANGRFTESSRKDGAKYVENPQAMDLKVYTDATFETQATSTTTMPSTPVETTMVWNANLNKYEFTFVGSNGTTLYLRSKECATPLTNLYFANGRHNADIIVDDVKIYKNQAATPVYRYTEMSTLNAEGGTNYKYTVAQESAKLAVGAVANATDINYGILYVQRSATLEEMKTLKGVEGYYMEKAVSKASVIPTNYDVTVAYNMANPGKRVTVLPYIRYTANGETVYLFADEVASTSPAKYMKDMLSTAVFSANANLYYASFYNAYTTAVADGGKLANKYAGTDLNALFSDIAASANQTEALEAMSSAGLEANENTYYTLLTDLFSVNA